jgi:hypothetical protein
MTTPGEGLAKVGTMRSSPQLGADGRLPAPTPSDRRGLPPAIKSASANETIAKRIWGYRLQLYFISTSPAVSHCRGLRYSWERLQVTSGNKIVENLKSIPIGAAVAGTDPNADTLLKPGDILAVHQITGWDNIGESISVEGEVKFPGSYGFKDGERLSAVCGVPAAFSRPHIRPARCWCESKFASCKKKAARS